MGPSFGSSTEGRGNFQGEKMYSTYKIEDGPVFIFNGSLLTVESDILLLPTPVSREELEQFVEWLKINLEKLNRDYWDSQHQKTACCDCVRPA